MYPRIQIYLILALCFTSFQDVQHAFPKEFWIGRLKNGTKLDSDDLKNILDRHKIWLNTDGNKGKQADLSNAHLSNADLRGVDLSKAFLRKANLSKVGTLASQI